MKKFVLMLLIAVFCTVTSWSMTNMTMTYTVNEKTADSLVLQDWSPPLFTFNNDITVTEGLPLMAMTEEIPCEIVYDTSPPTTSNINIIATKTYAKKDKAVTQSAKPVLSPNRGQASASCYENNATVNRTAEEKGIPLIFSNQA